LLYFRKIHVIFYREMKRSLFGSVHWAITWYRPQHWHQGNTSQVKWGNLS